MTETNKYDIALYFAGEDRVYVEAVANKLKQYGINVFYDSDEEVELWGKDLYVHLSDVYNKNSRYTVMFISEHYAKKHWTNHERKNAQAKAFIQNEEYILPARFDDTEIPGLLKTVGYINLKNRTPEDLAILILKKLGKTQTKTNSTVTLDKNDTNTLVKISKQDLRTDTIGLQKLIDIAYSTSGLDMSRQASREWAIRMSAELKGKNVSLYVTNLTLLINLAYSTSGLDLSRSDSRNWAIEMVSKLNENIVQEFVTDLTQLINFAYSTTGLDLSRVESKNWALQKIKEKYFT